MADQSESAGSTVEHEKSLMEKISEKIHDHESSSSSSSDSDNEKPESPKSEKPKVFRIFGREKPVHHVFGGGKRTDILSLSMKFFIYFILFETKNHIFQKKNIYLNIVF